MVARERIHHGLVKGVPHVQNTRDVGRGELNSEAGFVGIEPCVKVAAFFPNRVPTRFNVTGVVAFSKFR